MIVKRENLPTADPGRDYARGDDWREQAACKDTARYGSSPWDHDAHPDDHAYAMVTCLSSCPVIDLCHEFARTHRPDGGVWAGVLHQTRST